MMWPDLTLFALLFVLFISVIAFNRITQTHKVYLGFHFLMMLWPLGQFSVFATDHLNFQLFFVDLSFFAFGALGPGFLIFVYFLTGRAERLKPDRLLLLLLPAILSTGAALWNPSHLFMTPLGNDYINREYGSLFWILVLVQYAYLILSVVNMFQALKTVNSIHQRKQIAIALIGMFVLSGFGLIDVLLNVVLAPWLPIIPGLLALGILLADLCFVIAIYRYGMFDLLSMAQRDILEHMTMGIIVVDADGKVLEVNHGVTSFTQVSKGMMFDMEKFLNPLDAKGEVYEFLYRYSHNPQEKIQMELDMRDQAGKHVSIQISPIMDNRKALLGRIITFHDVTELRKLVVEMNKKNEVLHERNLELITTQEELFRVNQKLEQLAITDVLTGCFNRRYLMQQLEHELLVNKRYQVPFSIFLFDIDHFKQINDRYGHLTGDEVIRSTTDIVRSKLRRTDLFARYGGEEFTIYLPHTNDEQAKVLASRIIEAVESNKVPSDMGDVSITVSMGVVSEESTDLTFEDPIVYLRELFARADAALYKAKNEGRNRVVVAS
jgi:two-component system, cell cycle response regulator